MEPAYNGAALEGSVSKDRIVTFDNNEDINSFSTNVQDAHNIPTDLSLPAKGVEHLRMTMERKVERHEPTVALNGKAFASRQTIATIAASPKSAKTLTITGTSSAASTKDGINPHIPSIRCAPNPNHLAVVVIDNEQSPEDQQDQVKSAMRAAGFKTTPEHYRHYTIRQVRFTEYRKVVEQICESSCTLCKGIHSIFIDLSTAFVRSVNNETEVALAIEFFRWLAIKYDCAVIVTIHLNPGIGKERGPAKERGHFGSELQRESYAVAHIERKGDVFTIKPVFFRKAGTDGFTPIKLAFDENLGGLVQVKNDHEPRSIKSPTAPKPGVLNKIFHEGIPLTHKELIPRIMKETGRKERTASDRVTEWTKAEFIKSTPDNKYYLNVPE